MKCQDDQKPHIAHIGPKYCKIKLLSFLFCLIESFWLGNDLLHRATATSQYRLKIILKSWFGDVKTIKYETFSVDSESQKYKLTALQWDGQGLDVLAKDHGMFFTTLDRDHDYTIYDIWDGQGWKSIL